MFQNKSNIYSLCFAFLGIQSLFSSLHSPLQNEGGCDREEEAFVYLVEMLFCSLKNALIYPLTKCSFSKCSLVKRAFWQRI